MRGAEQIPWLYDGFFFFTDHLGFERWRGWLTGGARGRTLEVGCGTGRNLPRYGDGVALVAMDPHAQNLRKARRRAPDVPLVRASAEHLPFKDGAFDTVVSSLVFCSVPDPHRGFREIARVLAPGGRLRMIEHVRDHRRLWARWQDLYQPAWTVLTGGCHPNRDTERTVTESGFDIETDTHRANGTMRRFQAHLKVDPGSGGAS